jgi:hypothetical protein
MSASVGISRTFAELVRYMAQQGTGLFAEATDWNVGSVQRTLSEGVAVVGERLSENLTIGLAEGIERGTYRSFDFPVLPASRATGVITASRSVTTTSVTLPAGTRVAVPNSTKVYQTLDSITLGIGVASATGRIQAVDLGSFYNAPALAVTQLLSGGGGLAVSNAAAIDGGEDEETDEARKARFKDFIQTLHRGTADAIAHGVRGAQLLDGGGSVTEQVVSAQVADGYAVASCYVWNGTSPSASVDLLARAQEIIDGYTDGVTGALVPGYKAAGVAVTARAATLQPQAVSVVVYTGTGFTFNMVRAGVERAIRDVFDRLQVGTTRLRLNRPAAGDRAGAGRR